MALSIKDEETDGLVRRLAADRRLSYTAAIKLAVSNELAKQPPPVVRTIAEREAAIDEIQRRWASYPPIDMKEVDDWLYDENGLPR